MSPAEMIFSSTSPRDDLSESIHHFLLDAVARKNNSTENLEVNIALTDIHCNYYSLD